MKTKYCIDCEHYKSLYVGGLVGSLVDTCNHPDYLDCVDKKPGTPRQNRTEGPCGPAAIGYAPRTVSDPDGEAA